MSNNTTAAAAVIVPANVTPGRLGGTFVNLTNHPAVNWSPEQVEAVGALGYCRIVDLPGGMPIVPPTATSGEVFRLAGDILRRAGECLILVDEDDIVYGDIGFAVQGEPTLTQALVQRATAPTYSAPIGDCYAATTDRQAVETVGPDGTVTKTSVFKFVQWRQY